MLMKYAPHFMSCQVVSSKHPALINSTLHSVHSSDVEIIFILIILSSIGRKFMWKPVVPFNGSIFSNTVWIVSLKYCEMPCPPNKNIWYHNCFIKLNCTNIIWLHKGLCKLAKAVRVLLFLQYRHTESYHVVCPKTVLLCSCMEIILMIK